MPGELHLSVELDGTGHRPAESLTAAHWTDLIGLAEQGALDFVSLGDSLAPPPDDRAGRLDAVSVLARVAPATSRIGLVHARLWDSWEHDAEIRDAATGRDNVGQRLTGCGGVTIDGVRSPRFWRSVRTRPPVARPPPLNEAFRAAPSDGTTPEPTSAARSAAGPSMANCPNPPGTSDRFPWGPAARGRPASPKEDPWPPSCPSPAAPPPPPAPTACCAIWTGGSSSRATR